MRSIFLMIFGISFMLTACVSSGLSNTGNTNRIPAYLPYVESVETIPTTLHENHGFDIVIHLSSQLNPGALRGIPHSDWGAGIRWPWVSEFRTFEYTTGSPVNVINPWIIDLADYGDLTESITVKNIPVQGTGTHVIKIYSADSREWGGLKSEHVTGTSGYSMPSHPHAIYREFEITVLPAEE